jgi:cytochrome c peroxidase
VAFLDDDAAYVHAFLDRTVGSLKAKKAATLLENQLADGDLVASTFAAGGGIEFAARALDADAEAGRRLFFSATASQMAADGAGVSCSTCHFDGRNDGLTWSFEDGVRQTPSLAGAVAVTAPFTWTDQVATVGDEAEVTSSGRMGGEGLSYAEAAQVAAYIETIRAVDLPGKGSTDAGVLRGKALFARADVGCGGCHAGERYTDNAHHPMYGLSAVNTPTLVGVAFTAPYLHDGSAANLEAVVDGATGGGMGDTSMLSASERADLVAYLKSL